MKNNEIVIFGLYGRSGMWHYTTQYSNALSTFKNVSLVCPSYADKTILKNEIKILKLKTTPKITSFILESLNIFQHMRIIKKIKKINPKTIHFLDNHPWSIPYMIYFKLNKKNILLTQHDPIQHTGEKRLIIQDIINKIQRRLSNHILIHGNYIKRKLIEDYKIDKNKLIVFQHGDYNFIKKYDKLNIKTEENTILFFGRIVKYKGLDLLLDSLYQLKQKKIKFKLIIAGEGNLNPYKNKIKKIKNNCEIHNKFINEKDIPSFFKRAKCIILPYKDATQTGIIPIAYAFKKPVIVTNVGSLPEVVDNEKTGLIIDQSSISLGKAITNLLKRSDYKQMCENAYLKMKEKLDWNKNIKNILKYYT